MDLDLYLFYKKIHEKISIVGFLRDFFTKRLL